MTTDLIVRDYGTGADCVIVLHGGPGAAGDAAPLARELGKRWHVLEPFQRGSGAEPLSVGTHIRDLDDVIRERCGESRPVLVGHSWGAMLALAYATEHPARAAGLALIGCGTFSGTARAEFQAGVEARLTPKDRALLAHIEGTEPNANRRMAEQGRVITRALGYDVEAGEENARVDAAAHDQTWTDMLRLQQAGVYPAAFAAIRVPVLMLHGKQDQHPGRLIEHDLRAYIPHLEYHEFDRCGHYPWLERQARRAFFDTLARWLHERFPVRSGG